VKRRHVENHKSGAAHLVKERKRKTLNDPPIAIVNQTYLELTTGMLAPYCYRQMSVNDLPLFLCFAVTTLTVGRTIRYPEP
jgi:hypothetical protein